MGSIPNVSNLPEEHLLLNDLYLNSPWAALDESVKNSGYNRDKHVFSQRKRKVPESWRDFKETFSINIRQMLLAPTGPRELWDRFWSQQNQTLCLSSEWCSGCDSGSLPFWAALILISYMTFASQKSYVLGGLYINMTNIWYDRSICLLHIFFPFNHWSNPIKMSICHKKACIEKII